MRLCSARGFLPFSFFGFVGAAVTDLEWMVGMASTSSGCMGCVADRASKKSISSQV